jgi:hypothetical protein
MLYHDKDDNVEPFDSAIEDLMRLFGHTQVKFWLE